MKKLICLAICLLLTGHATAGASSTLTASTLNALVSSFPVPWPTVTNSLTSDSIFNQWFTIDYQSAYNANSNYFTALIQVVNAQQMLGFTLNGVTPAVAFSSGSPSPYYTDQNTGGRDTLITVGVNNTWGTLAWYLNGGAWSTFLPDQQPSYSMFSSTSYTPLESLQNILGMAQAYLVQQFNSAIQSKMPGVPVLLFSDSTFGSISVTTNETPTSAGTPPTSGAITFYGLIPNSGTTIQTSTPLSLTNTTDITLNTFNLTNTTSLTSQSDFIAVVLAFAQDQTNFIKLMEAVQASSSGSGSGFWSNGNATGVVDLILKYQTAADALASLQDPTKIQPTAVVVTSSQTTAPANTHGSGGTRKTLWKYASGSAEYHALLARGAQVYELSAPNSGVCVIGKTYGGTRVKAAQVKQKCHSYAESRQYKHNSGSITVAVG